MTLRIGVTGGIGSGKSTVCREFQHQGIPVYVADDRAKALMQESDELIGKIKQRFGEDCYSGKELQRKILSSRVFGNDEALRDLNNLVHPAVFEDFERWTSIQDAPYVLCESAILFSSRLVSRMDYSLGVTAPVDLRITRAMLRDGVSKELIEKRIAAQKEDEEALQYCNFKIDNSEGADLMTQVSVLDAIFRSLSM